MGKRSDSGITNGSWQTAIINLTKDCQICAQEQQEGS